MQFLKFFSFRWTEKQIQSLIDNSKNVIFRQLNELIRLNINSKKLNKLEDCKDFQKILQDNKYGHYYSILTQVIQKTLKNFLNEKVLQPPRIQLIQDISSTTKQKDQITKDTARSFNSIDEYKNLPLKDKYQESLTQILLSLFSKHSEYEYYQVHKFPFAVIYFQGYHDIVSIFQVTCGNNWGYYLSEYAAQNYFKDSLIFPFDQSVIVQLKLIKCIIKKIDPKFYECFKDFDLYFALPWLITWFSHSLSKEETIKRIFDYLLSSKPEAILMLCSSALLIQKQGIYEILQQNEEEDQNFPLIHQYFQNFEQNLKVPLENIIQYAIKIEKNIDIYNIIEKEALAIPQNSIFWSEKKQREQAKALQFAKKGFKIIYNIMSSKIGMIGISIIVSTVLYQYFKKNR